MKGLKIAFLSHLDLNLYLFRLSWMKALIKEDSDVYAVIPKGDYNGKIAKEGITVMNYPIDRGGLNPFRELKTIYSLYRIFKKEHFNLIHAFTIKPNIYGAVAGKLAGIPIILNHVEGLGYIYTINNFKTRILKFLSNRLYRLSFKIAKKVIFQNPDDFVQLSNLFDNGKALIIKGTGVDTNYFSLGNVDLKKVKIIKDEIGIDNDKLVITMIARLYWSKGIKELVQTANMLSKKYCNLVFLIIGWIDKGNPDAISQEFIKETGNEFIKFTGKRDDIREILYLTDIYVLPSYREGMPRTVLEAMAMEKAIVTTNAPGCKETVENGVNGLLVPIKNSKVLAEAIEKLITDENLRARMGKTSREKAIKEFSNEIVIDKILKLYKKLCQGAIDANYRS